MTMKDAGQAEFESNQLEFADFDDAEQDAAVENATETATRESQGNTTPESDDFVPPPEVPAEFADSGEEAEGTPPPDKAEESKWDEGLLNLAGIDRETAGKHFKNQEELEAALRWQDAQALQTGRQWMEQQAQPRQQQAPQPQQRQQQAQQPQPPQDDEFKLDLDPEEWGQETVALLNKMHQFYTGKIQTAMERSQKLEMVLGGMHHQKVQQEADAYLAAFDAKCNQLPSELKEVFGDGNRASLNPQGKEFQSRVRLNQAMAAIQTGRQANGLPALSQDQLFDRALRAEFPEAIERTVRKDVSTKLTGRLKQTTARPTSRQGSALTPEQAAQKRVNDFYAKRGLTLVEDQADEADGV